jgi:hypothetical protein
MIPDLTALLSTVVADLSVGPWLMPADLPAPAAERSSIPAPDELWWFLPRGYLLTVAVEAPVLLIGLCGRHSIARRLFAGVWLTACTYPVFVLSLSQLLASATSFTLYVVIGEILVAAAECALFWIAFGREPATKSDKSAHERSDGGVPDGKPADGAPGVDAEPAAARPGGMWRDFAVIVLANLASIAAGEIAHRAGWLDR